MKSIEDKIDDLKSAGWVAKTPTIWNSPLGKLYIGPHGAWKVMKKMEEEDERPDHM